jgi:hypothetical protein
MANFNLKIDLGRFWGAKVITTKSGEEVVVIPIAENHLMKGKNGSVYANLQATEKKSLGQYGDSHFIKPRFSKEAFSSLTDEQRNSIPFVGSVYAPQNNYGNNNGGYNNNAPSYTPTVSANDIDDSIF